MAKTEILAGATSESVDIFIQDSSSTIGAGLTGLAFNTASLTCYYTFTGANAGATAVTLATLAAVNSAYSSGGFKEIDATNMPGHYRFDPPNAGLATSKGRLVTFHFKGATNMAPLPFEITLTATNNQSATAFITSVATVTTVTNQLTAAQIATGVWQDATAGDFTTASSIGKSLYTSGVVPGGTNGLFIAGTNAATTVTTSFTTTFTGNLTGSVASVTGAVGSVTGAVGSVTGLTASNLDTTVSSRMATYTQPSGFLAATFPGGTIASTTNITAGTLTTVTTATNLTTNNDKTGYALSATGSAAFTESYAADGATATLPQLLYMTLAMLSEFSISGTTLTAKKLDGSTTAGTFTLDSSTAPTSITRAT